MEETQISQMEGYLSSLMIRVLDGDQRKFPLSHCGVVVFPT